ncbi:hypothetical protein [Amycolatopsis benzoatilytica]|uniref:hypothetical protein n=1 Tax=Amycolatopsis benzoatilytica TaxID=346045 RepID=UPI00037E601D|nr:hypothetical protein [Amycolatopsis benzoatilytica]
MSTPIDDDSWKTPELREAEAALDRTVRKSQQLLKDLEKIKIPPLPKVDIQARIDSIKKAAAKPDAPAQLRLIKKKVDEGKLTWEDVASGKAFADPDVRALADEKLGEAKEIMEELEEGQSPDEILEARTGGSGSMLADNGRSSYQAPAQDEPAGYSSADPLASSSSPAYPAPAEPEPAEYSNDDPLAVRDPRPEPPKEEKEEEPPAKPEVPPAAPRASRHRAEEVEDDFANPLTDRGQSRPEPPSAPRSAPPSSGRRARRDEPGEDDDYFGGSFLR